MTAPSAALSLPDLTVPRGSTATARTVINGYLREAIRTFVSLPTASLRPPARELLARTVAMTESMLRTDPRPIVSVFRRPTHAALLWASAARPDESEKWLVELCLLIHLELAAFGHMPATEPIHRIGESWPDLRSIDANLELRLNLTVDSLAFSPGQLLMRRGSQNWKLSLRTVEIAPDLPAKVERPYRHIVDRIALALTDNNPLSMEEAHPDKFGNAIDLGGHSEEEWIETLRESFKLIDAYLPLIGEEMRLLLRLIVPVGFHDQKHFSASYQEAVGTIYMTLHPNLMTMTEALVHEFQHNKINAAFHLDPMLRNAFSPLYASPVRPDPRPLHGVILAVHAFQPIAVMYERMTEAKHPLSTLPQFQQRFRDIIRMNRAGSRTVLENAQPTPVGAALFDEMRALEREQLDYENSHWKEIPAEGPVQALPE